MFSRLVVAAILAWLGAPAASALDAAGMAVVINTRDPASVATGEAYAARRGLSFQHVIRVAFEPGRSVMGVEEFAAVRADVLRQSGPRVQAWALAWTAPYRVDCMSITAAFAFGFDPGWCAEGCRTTRASPLFMARTRVPFSDLRVRPAMLLAARSVESAKALIERGVAADATHPSGTAYLLSTSDAARNVRHLLYRQAEAVMKGRLAAVTLRQDALEHAKDVLFYFTGLPRVDGLETLGFLPGAIADHLTSAGGMLTDSGQMSALAWLEAGATGSYGAVVEPCNFLQKFPHPAVVAEFYLRGETLIEAYWKSVQMPGQGVFIGEPLAAPFATARGRVR